jgi:hypothetical protein
MDEAHVYEMWAKIDPSKATISLVEFQVGGEQAIQVLIGLTGALSIYKCCDSA